MIGRHRTGLAALLTGALAALAPAQELSIEECATLCREVLPTAEELAWRLGWMALAWLYLLFFCARVWRGEDRG